jgi:hypothetical protein
MAKIKTIRPNEPNFIINDGIIVASRAGFEIDKYCPYEYKLIISECIDRGWIKPIANVYEKQLTMDILRD